MFLHINFGTNYLIIYRLAGTRCYPSGCEPYFILINACFSLKKRVITAKASILYTDSDKLIYQFKFPLFLTGNGRGSLHRRFQTVSFDSKLMATIEICEEISSASFRPFWRKWDGIQVKLRVSVRGKITCRLMWLYALSNWPPPPSQFLIKTLCYFRVLLDPPKAYRRRMKYNYYEVYEWRCLL